MRERTVASDPLHQACLEAMGQELVVGVQAQLVGLQSEKARGSIQARIAFRLGVCAFHGEAVRFTGDISVVALASDETFHHHILGRKAA